MKRRAFLLAAPNTLLLVVSSLRLGLTCDYLPAYPAYCLFGIIGLVAALIGIVYGIRRGRKGIPLAILCAVTIGAYALLPTIWSWRDRLEFATKRREYMEVVELVQQGRIVAGSTPLANIDAAHEDLMPCTKQIAIERSSRGLSIIFFTGNGIFGEFEGHMFVEDDRPPTIEQFRDLRALNPDQWTSIERLTTNWYSVAWDH